MRVCFVHLACLSTFHREQTSMLVRNVKNESFSSPLWKCCLAFAVNRTDGVTMQASNFQINSAAHRTNCVFCRRNSMTGPEEIRSRRDKHTQRQHFAFLSLLENTQTCGAEKALKHAPSPSVSSVDLISDLTLMPHSSSESK